jgi:hypothetical protein
LCAKLAVLVLLAYTALEKLPNFRPLTGFDYVKVWQLADRRSVCPVGAKSLPRPDRAFGLPEAT